MQLIAPLGTCFHFLCTTSAPFICAKQMWMLMADRDIAEEKRRLKNYPRYKCSRLRGFAKCWSRTRCGCDGVKATGGKTSHHLRAVKQACNVGLIWQHTHRSHTHIWGLSHRERLQADRGADTRSCCSSNIITACTQPTRLIIYIQVLHHTLQARHLVPKVG